MSIRWASQVSSGRGRPRTERRRFARASIALGACALLALGASGCRREAEKAPEPKLDTDVARASYGLGYNIAGNIRNQYGPALDTAAFRAGLDDKLADQKMRVSEDQVLAGLNALNEARESARQGAAEKNLADGKAFLAKNGARVGVVTLPSGLEYEVMKAGDGPKPNPTDEVVTHYHGTLIDGSVFDSSVDRGEPVTFAVNQVIRGWQEALVLMPVGSKWKLFIPAELAYGAQGAGARIGPNETLVFEVELLEIKKPG